MMKNKNTLYIAEWQKFGVSKIEKCLNGKDRAEIAKKAVDYFNELADFSKCNSKLLGFHNKTTLHAKNFVGLIQTKSGFCVEILPKVFDSKIKENCECKLKPNLVPQKAIKEFVENLERDEKIYSEQDKINTHYNECQAKQILLNCLATLKNTKFEKLNLANVKTLKLPLLEIFVIMFLDELENLIKRGIRSDYKIVEENRKFLKGKLLFGENLKRNLVHKERFYTHSDEYSADISPNRLIKSTILWLCGQNLSPNTSRRLNQVRFIFDEILPSQNISADFAKCHNNRHFRHYELLLSWCEIFLKKQSFTPYNAENNAFALLFNMNELFESFVAHYVKKFASGEVKIQSNAKFLMSDNGTKLFNLKPDIVVKNGDKILILDTKWKIINFQDSQDCKDGVSQGDLYQMWAYASKYAKDCENIKVFLIYPLCEATQKLQKLWNDENKKWTFKANENIALKLAFFPLITQQKND